MYNLWKTRRYAILNCQNCECCFVAVQDIVREESGWFVVHPISRKNVSEEIPEPINSELAEANLCFALGAYRACAAMCQIALEALWRDKEVSGLNELKERGIISEQLFDRATEIRLWANLIKHEVVVEVVTQTEVNELLVYLEAITNSVYVEPKRLSDMKRKREEIEKKKT